VKKRGVVGVDGEGGGGEEVELVEVGCER